MCTPPIAFLICALWHIGSVNGYIGPRQDPLSAASAQSATVTPIFSFNKISEPTTCKPAVIPWSYSPITASDVFELTLFITNDGVAQPAPPLATTSGTFTLNPRAMQRRDVTTQQINSDPIDPLVRAFTWSAVNVTAGWYELTATLSLPGFLKKSLAFYIENGTDISCLTPTRTSPFSSIPSKAASSHSATSTASVSPSTGVPTVTPGPSNVNRGILVGGIIGGLAVLCGAIAAYLYRMRLRRRRNILLLYTPVPPVLLRPSAPPPMRSKGATAVVVTPKVQPPAVPATTAAPNVPLPAAVETPEVLHPDQQHRLNVEERLRYLEEQLASVTQPPAYN
ncbi:hypothetical protein DFH08DRAFT_841827 [Mycena albidolilacea]|uniref:Uncharacterized protein n=1 Tax=Mycena albidolilacea TaxID=1033008 RepID=A0AAD7F327_9AGAR|nr:hypothetical protein DFH08DRAFT_841827 [Mycena albidolilacea]